MPTGPPLIIWNNTIDARGGCYAVNVAVNKRVVKNRCHWLWMLEFLEINFLNRKTVHKLTPSY